MARRLDQRQRDVARRFGQDSDALRNIDAERARLSETSQSARRERDKSRLSEQAAFTQFLPFTDPRENLSQLPDAAPFLLFPVRLETRFKTFTQDGQLKHQLWVRVFPDQCSIDTFDDLLSTSEVIRARNYWAAVWSAGTPSDPSLAGFVRDKTVAAWRALMGSFNAGRAHWVTTRHQPSNPADIPVRNLQSDVLVIIVSTALPSPVEQSALKAYWGSVIKAGASPSSVAAGLTNLMSTTGLGSDAARQLIEQNTPQELATLVKDGPKGDVRVTFITFDTPADVKQSAWAHVAKVRTFPERFVLLGYQANDQPPIVNEIGKPIPNPLIAGPGAQDDVEALLKELYGADVDTFTDEEKAAKYVEYLAQQSDTSWLFDFQRAVELGLGFRVDLTPAQYRGGFSRLLVLGVQMSASAAAGKNELEELFANHQFGDAGFSLLAQGTPTNNTEETKSGYAIRESAEDAYARYHETAAITDTDDREPVDGALLARALGIDADLAGLRSAENYASTDQAEARAMQTALWSATLGFFLESMVPGLASENTRALVQRHFLEHVRGRGSLPALRVGKQPYGVLVLSHLKAYNWPLRSLRSGRASAATLAALFTAAMRARADLQDALTKVAHVGGSADPHVALLRVLGLHASSVEFDRRIAESFPAIGNTQLLAGLPAAQSVDLQKAYRDNGVAMLTALGYEGSPSDGDLELKKKFPIFDRAFFAEQEDVTKPAIDDNPLSEERLLGPCTAAGQNYIEWLIDKAEHDHSAIRQGTGFLPDKAPVAILFDLLCHSINLEFRDTALSLFQRVGLLNAVEARDLRLDREFIGIQKRQPVIESKWDLLYRTEPSIAADKTIAEHISSLLLVAESDDSAAQLAVMLNALRRLAKLPTARLERCFAEHLDLCHYRLDAWLLSFVNAQLDQLRSAPADNPDEAIRGVPASSGTYLGAYGWVTDLRPKSHELSPVELDAEQRAALDPKGTGPIVRDSGNAGYIHAPSLPHGLTAAVLRNAYISSASSAEPDRYKVNLSSERVRSALSLIEGIQQGQGLAELLGYQFERALHDNTALELDAYVYELRKVFPLVSNRLRLTAVRKGRVAKSALEATRFAEEEAEFDDERAVTKVEARNVVNGLALLERVSQPGNAKYPFGFPIGTGPGELRDANAFQRAAIEAEVERLKNARDAVADLALAESVHQTVQGNYERAAGALDAFSKGAFPQLPDVVQSPASGLGLTHRFGVHFPAGISPDVGKTPRSKAEPALNAWLVGLFPPAASIGCNVRFRPRPDPASAPGAWSNFPVTLAALGLEPIDLLYLHDADSAKNLSALDDQVLSVFKLAAARRLDLEIEIDYVTAPGLGISFFQLGALLAVLRPLTLASRPLEASDLALQNEGSKRRNASASVAPARLQKARAALDLALGGLQTNILTPLGALIDLDDPSVGAANFAAVLAAIDGWVDQFMAKLAPLNAFGLEGSGSAFVIERLRAIRTRLVELVRERAASWKDRSERYQAIIDNELPLATSDDQRIEIWHRAEQQVSTTFTTVFTSAAVLGTLVAAKRTAFESKRTAATALSSGAFTTLASLFGASEALLTGTLAFDLEPLALKEPARMLLVLAEDLLRQASKVHALGTKNSTRAAGQISDAASASDGGLALLTKAAQTLFGETFKLYPEFSLGTAQVQELQLCLGDQAQLLKYQTDVVQTDNPTEDWLYGVARVRERLAAWETATMLAEGFVARPPMNLTPIQLPYRSGDTWLALAHSPEHEIQGDNLLYTAYAPGFDPTGRIVGALVDEWTETLPSRQETTALTFHFDRPNCEAPQSLLLVTPAALTGQWQWSDLVGALHEALDLARVRALEPDVLDTTAYARLLPATVATLTVHPVTMALNFAFQPLSTKAVSSAASVTTSGSVAGSSGTP
jgi:hypothetical protein